MKFISGILIPDFDIIKFWMYKRSINDKYLGFNGENESDGFELTKVDKSKMQYLPHLAHIFPSASFLFCCYLCCGWLDTHHEIIWFFLRALHKLIWAFNLMPTSSVDLPIFFDITKSTKCVPISVPILILGRLRLHYVIINFGNVRLLAAHLPCFIFASSPP